MAQFIRANSDFGDAFSRTFAQSLHYAQQEAERKRQEEANKQLGQLYFDMASKDAYKAVAPYQQNATNKIMQANTADSNLSAVNAPITTAPDRLADTRSLRFMSMTPEERAQAGITSEQSAQMDNTLKAEGPVNVQQANAGVANTLAPIASQANNQAQSAEQMLAMAKEKYGTDMFDKMQPYIGKIPSDKLIGIVNNMQAKAQQQADKLALNSAMAVFGRKDASDDEKKQAAVTIATLKPELGKMFQNFFAPKDDSFTLSPGQTRFVNGKPVASIAPKPDRPTTAGRFIVQTLEDGSRVRVDTMTGETVQVSPAKPTGDIGNLTKPEKTQMDILEKYLKSFESKYKTPSGSFDEDKASESQEYANYLKFKDQHRELLTRALTPKEIKGKEQVSVAEYEQLVKNAMAKGMTEEQARAFILRNADVNPDDRRR